MIISLEDKLISSELFERKFVCDLNACKGACCVEGDNGAPLSDEEVQILKEIYPKVKPYMRSEGIEAVEKNGVSYLDQWQKPATTLVNNKECAFVFFDEKGITKCSIEAANLNGDISFKKPISCHLYPIRVTDVGEAKALNYEYWDICKAACVCGEKLNVPVYKFLKEPLIRAYGESFFKDLEGIHKTIEDNRLEE